MKRKLTSGLLAIAVMFSMSVPAFAADGQSATRSDCPSQLVWQLLWRCGACGQTQGDCEALLRDWLAACGTPTVQPWEKPAPAEKTDAPAEKPDETPQEAQTPDASQKPSQGVTGSVRAYEQEVVRLVNAERAKAGLAPLSESAELSSVARMKSQDMHDQGYFDHNSPTYGTPFQLMRSQGIRYRTAGENIAMGYRTPEAVVSAWMNSPGHRANILGASYTTIGVGYVASGNYWTQHFIG